jgi:hypothetical protein
VIKTFEEFQWNKLNPFKKKKVVPPLNPRDEIDPYHEENWDEVVAPEPVRQPMMNVDPFGEEDWGNDDEYQKQKRMAQKERQKIRDLGLKHTATSGSSSSRNTDADIRAKIDPFSE